MTEPVRHEGLAEKASSDIWYHNIELTHGVVTRGRINTNATIVRRLLEGVDVKDRNCLDIGSMDCFYGILFERRGAKNVICTDRLNRGKQISLIRSTLNSRFKYYPNKSIYQLGPLVRKTFGSLAEITNLAGVLYHMWDPMAGLARARGLTRRGGLVLIDTPVVLRKTNDLVYNDDGAVYNHTTFFIPTPRSLEAMLARVGLLPLDFRISRSGKSLPRVAAICRAWDPIWINTLKGRRELSAAKPTVADVQNLNEFVEPGSVFAAEGRLGTLTPDDAAVPYRRGDKVLVHHRAEDCIELQEIADAEPTEWQNVDNILRLVDR